MFFLVAPPGNRRLAGTCHSFVFCDFLVFFTTNEFTVQVLSVLCHGHSVQQCGHIATPCSNCRNPLCLHRCGCYDVILTPLRGRP